MQIPISTTLELTSYSGIVSDQILGLLYSYFQGVQVYDGYRPPFGNPDAINGPVKFPCFMVEMSKLTAKMPTTQKYDRKYEAIIFAYVTGNNLAALKQKQLAYAEGLVKLFSNNADSNAQANGEYKMFTGSGGGFGAGGYGSGGYDSTTAFWYNSEFSGDIILSPAYNSPGSQNEYVRAIRANMTFVARVLQ